MTNVLVINNKTLLSIRDATAHVSYSKDYITRLAREKKIAARWVGRQWFVDVESLKAYSADAQAEQELRKQRLSDERKHERVLRAELLRQAEQRKVASKRAPMRAAVMIVAAVLFGIIFTSGLMHSMVDRADDFSQGQVATVFDADLVPMIPSSAGSSGSAIVPHFSVAATEVHATTTGVVLLPDGLQSLEKKQLQPGQLFSDVVTTRTKQDGSKVLVMTDDTGSEVVLPILAIPIPPDVSLTDPVTTAYD